MPRRSINSELVEKHLIFTAQVPVRWIDMDALAHVNNTVYFGYFEQARTAWLQTVGVPLRQIETGPIIANASCDYLKPIIYPADLNVKMYIGEIKRTSFTLYYDIEDKNNPQILYAEGSTVVVWVDYQVGKPIVLPDFIHEQLTKK